MSQKTSSTKTTKKGKRATKAAEPSTREVTFTFRAFVSDSITDADLETWRRDAELYARLLESDETPEAFKVAFGAIYVDDLYNASEVANITDPEMVRIIWPLIMANGSVCEAREYFEGVSTCLTTLRGELCGVEHFERIRVAVQSERKGVRADG